MWGALFCFIFQEKNPHIKNFEGRILTGGIWGVFLYVYVLFSAPGKWGRTHMGLDGFNRILTGVYLFSPVEVRLVPLRTHDFKGF